MQVSYCMHPSTSVFRSASENGVSWVTGRWHTPTPGWTQLDVKRLKRVLQCQKFTHRTASSFGEIKTVLNARAHSNRNPTHTVTERLQKAEALAECGYLHILPWLIVFAVAASTHGNRK